MTIALFGTISSLFLTLRLYGYTKISGIVLNILLLYTNNEKSQPADCEFVWITILPLINWISYILKDKPAIHKASLSTQNT